MTNDLNSSCQDSNRENIDIFSTEIEFFDHSSPSCQKTQFEPFSRWQLNFRGQTTRTRVKDPCGRSKRHDSEARVGRIRDKHDYDEQDTSPAGLS